MRHPIGALLFIALSTIALAEQPKSLAERLKTILAAGNFSIEKLSTDEALNTPTHLEMPILVTGRATFEGLNDLCAKMEGSGKFAIDALTIAIDPDNPKTHRVTLNVTGYLDKQPNQTVQYFDDPKVHQMLERVSDSAKGRVFIAKMELKSDRAAPKTEPRQIQSRTLTVDILATGANTPDWEDRALRQYLEFAEVLQKPTDKEHPGVPPRKLELPKTFDFSKKLAGRHVMRCAIDLEY